MRRLLLSAILSAAPLFGQAPYAPFVPGPMLATGSPAVASAGADVDGDGLPDVVFACASPDALVPVLQGGPGILATVGASSPIIGASPTALTSAFVNGDAIPDFFVGLNAPPYLAVANSYAPAAWSIGPLPGAVGLIAPVASASAGSVDFDGYADVAVCFGTAGAATVQVFRGGPGGTFTSALTIVGGSITAFPTVVRLVDLNGDFADDLLVGLSGSTVDYYPSDAAGGFLPPINVGSTTSPIHDLVVADFDADGLPDVAALLGAGFAGVAGAAVFRGVAPGVFGPGGAVLYGGPTGGAHRQGVAIDVNRDGFPDLVCATGSAGVVEGFVSDGFGGFMGPSGGVLPETFQIAVASGVFAPAVVNLDNDLDQDLVVCSGASLVVPLHTSAVFATYGRKFVGTPFSLTFDAPPEASKPFIMAAAAAPAPGYLLPDGRVIPISIVDGSGMTDLLFTITTTPGCFGFCGGFLGTLDAQGRTTAFFTTPNLPFLVGLPLFFAAVTADPTAPSGVSVVANGQFVMLL